MQDVCACGDLYGGQPTVCHNIYCWWLVGELGVYSFEERVIRLVFQERTQNCIFVFILILVF